MADHSFSNTGDSTVFTILLVEDSPADALLMQEVFEHAQTSCSIWVAEDGERALEILADDMGVLPKIILMDMNLPRQSGLAILRTIKSDERLRHIPVIMLSGSRAADDIQAAYHAYVTSYVLKPTNVEEYKAFLYAFEAYWMHIAVLPQ